MTIDTFLVVEWIIKALISTIVLLTVFAYMTYAERKVAALLQTRIGPNRAGPFGLLQPVADGLKLFFKEELIPGQADKFVFLLAPVITVVPALIILAVVPWGPTIRNFTCCYVPETWLTFIGGLMGTSLDPIGFTLIPADAPRTIVLGITDLNVGVLYILSVASIAVYGVTLAGWSSNNKYSMLGGIRSSAQMISYELALGLSFVGPVMLAGSMSMQDIVMKQSSVWFIVYQPLAAIIFYIAALAEVNRAPFDMPEAEQELTAGYHTEYSGMTFSLFFMSEYIKMAGVSAIFATLFLGGWQGPFVEQIPLLGLAYLSMKVAGSLLFMIWLRSTHPRLRYDRLMTFGWKILLPLSLANVVITAAANLQDSQALWWTVGGLVLAGLVLFVFNFNGIVAGPRKRAAIK